MFDLFHQGGPVLIAIFAFSVIAWMLIVANALRLVRLFAGGFDWPQLALNNLLDGKHIQALAICQSHPNLLGNILLRALQHPAPQRTLMEKHLTLILHAELTPMRQQLHFLAAIASVCTLLGLLGTVIGMVSTFAALTAAGSQAGAGMADGISQALITTQAGLIVALPILICHRMLTARLQRALNTATLTIKKFETALYHD